MSGQKVKKCGFPLKTVNNDHIRRNFDLEHLLLGFLCSLRTHMPNFRSKDSALCSCIFEDHCINISFHYCLLQKTIFLTETKKVESV